jgi:hypothetical protein
MKRKLYCVIAWIFLVDCGKKYADQPPRSPEESLKSIRINPDFKVDLFANEPMVYDPVEMVFDENGRIFVAEMLDYPEDPPDGKQALSRIVMLEDGRGRQDRPPHRVRRSRARGYRATDIPTATRTNTDSATTERSPPGVASRARVTIR